MYFKDKSLSFTVRLTPSQVLYLRQIAVARDKSVSQYIRDLVAFDMRLNSFSLEEALDGKDKQSI